MALPPPRTASPRYAVNPADADDLRAAQGLVAAAFGLSALETFPAWEMAVVTSNGGLALVAKDAKGVFGFSYAFPAFARGLGAYLYSNALVVDCSHAGLGVGRRLKLEQRRRAVNAGYTLIRWTTDALSSRNLFLYLTRLGARVTAVRREFMRGLLEQPVDQLQVDWDLTSSAPGHVDPPTLGDCVVLTSRVASPDEWPELIERSRRVDGWALELPWALQGRDAVPSRQAAPWRRAVASSAEHLIAAGYIGDAVVADRDERRSFLRFVPPTRLTH